METCNFCGLTKEKVDYMIGGPNKEYICNKCIAQCMEMWEDFKKEKQQQDKNAE